MSKPAKQWRNWYRMPAPIPAQFGVPTCTRCGEREEVEPGKTYGNHCAKFDSKEEAEYYAPNLYTQCQYLGAFEVGKSP